jgi:hypothetical protein
VTKLNNGKKSGKLLIVATVLTIVALASVLVVFAAILGTFQGGKVTVGGVTSGTIAYNDDNSTEWNANLQPAVSSPWYARIQVEGYSGPVTITWQLQIETAPSVWSDVGGATVTTTTILAGSSEYVYASLDGSQTSNHDWGSSITTGGTFSIKVTVASA